LEDGQLGYSGEDSSNLIQISFFNDKKINDFCCGGDSSYVLIGYFYYFFNFKFYFYFLEDGTVFSFGFNGYGDLGIGSTKNHSTPQNIKFENNEKIEKIFSNCCCCGCFFCSSYYFF
jgi:alpha-tubulin suppressor-like RCC1 family protein